MLKHKWKQIIFAIAIALLFIPMVYLGVNTFFPASPIEDCYDRSPPIKLCEPNDPSCIEQAREKSIEQKAC